MSFRKITVGLVFFVVFAVVWAAYEMFSTWRGIPDAYAAWDTGTLIIMYLESHDDQWPRSWDELLSVAETLDEHGKRLRGANGEGGFIYGDLPNRVSIDWDVDSEAIVSAQWKQDRLPVRMVTRADGKDFPVVWEGAEPNEMIWKYFRSRNSD